MITFRELLFEPLFSILYIICWSEILISALKIWRLSPKIRANFCFVMADIGKPGTPSKPPELKQVLATLPQHVRPPASVDDVDDRQRMVQRRAISALMHPQSHQIERVPMEVRSVVGSIRSPHAHSSADSFLQDRLEDDKAEFAANEMRRFLDFVFRSREQIGQMNFAPQVRTRMASAVQAVGPETMHRVLRFYRGMLVVTDDIEEGLCQEGVNSLFERDHGKVLLSDRLRQNFQTISSQYGFSVNAEMQKLMDAVKENYAQEGRNPSREQFIRDFVTMIEMYRDDEDYDDYQAHQGIRQELQRFVNGLGGGGNAHSDAQAMSQIVSETVKYGEPAGRFALMESLYMTGLKAAGLGFPKQSIPLALMRINRCLLQGYYIRYQMKLFGAAA